MLRLICAAALCAFSLQVHATSASAWNTFAFGVRDLDLNDGIDASASITTGYALFYVQDDSRGSTFADVSGMDFGSSYQAATSLSSLWIFRRVQQFGFGVITFTPHTELSIDTSESVTVSVDALGESATAIAGNLTVTLKVLGSVSRHADTSSVVVSGDEPGVAAVYMDADASVSVEPIVVPPPVPEPSSYALMAVGLAALAGRSRAPHGAKRDAALT